APTTPRRKWSAGTSSRPAADGSRWRRWSMGAAPLPSSPKSWKRTNSPRQHASLLHFGRHAKRVGAILALDGGDPRGIWVALGDPGLVHGPLHQPAGILGLGLPGHHPPAVGGIGIELLEPAPHPRIELLEIADKLLAVLTALEEMRPHRLFAILVERRELIGRVFKPGSAI